MEKNRKLSAGMPLKFTKVDKNNVKKVKLVTKPVTTPSGLIFPESSTEDDSIIGRIGRIQGDKTVIIPAKKAKVMSITMKVNVPSYK